jgi:predicted phage terminase large subunit-like protein
VVRIPAIAEEDEQHRAEPVFGRQCFGRREGEVLHPERRPPLMLEQIRRTLGEYNFAGQYQQSPSPMGGGMVKAVWFRGYAPNERPEEFDHVCRAGTAHVLRKRMEYPELKRGGICEQCEAFNASVVLIEDKASGTQLIQELVEPSLHAVTRYQPQSDKIMRMHAQTAMIENGFVYLPKDAGWLAEYLHELTVFPKGKHDDQIDSKAQMLDWFKRGSGPRSDAGIYQLYKELAEQARTQTPKPAPLSTLLPILQRW